jgi:polysaccharide biosynthesis transport protein
MNDRLDIQDEYGDALPQARPGFDLWGAVTRRKWLMIFGAAVGLGLGYLYFSREPAVFESAARIIVQRKHSPPPFQELNPSSRGESQLSTHALLLTSPLILERAQKTAEFERIRAGGETKPARFLHAGLNVSPVDNNPNVLQLTFRGADPRDCEAALSAVIKAYGDYLAETHVNIGQQTIDDISAARKTLFEDLQAKKKEYEQFRLEAPLLFQGNEGLNVHQQRLSAIEQQRSQLMLRRSTTRAALQSIETAMERGESREALLLMVGQQVERPETAVAAGGGSSLQQLFPLLLEEVTLREQFGENHPKVKLARLKIAMARKSLQGVANEEDAANAEGEPPADFLSIYLQSLREELKQIDEQESEFKRLFESEQASARTLLAFETKNKNLLDAIESTSQLFQAVVKRLQEVDVIKAYGGYDMQVVARPGIGWQVEPVLARTLAIFGVAGLFLGGVLALMVDAADKTFRNPDEVQAALRYPLVGHIPVLPVRKQSSDLVDPVLCTISQPKSQFTEAYRAVRTALYFSARGKKFKVLQVTSPTPGDGKSTLAANLAVCMAQSGKNVLLIDADFRKPRVHQLFRIPNDVGLASVVSGDAELDEAIRQGPVEHLSLMACGPRPSNPSELLISPRFQELLAVLRDKYDFVIVDTPPLLAVSDPAAIAPRVDGVLLTLRIRRHVRPHALRARDLLASLGANVLGVVVNCVGGRGFDARQYGGKGYNLGAGEGYGEYTYNSGYGYDYGDAEFENADEPVPIAQRDPLKAARNR